MSDMIKWLAVFLFCLALFFGFSWLAVWLSRVADLMPHGDVTAIQQANQFAVGALSVLCGAIATFGVMGALGTAMSFVEKFGSKPFKEWANSARGKA
jgi:hypothetical protein